MGDSGKIKQEWYKISIDVDQTLVDALSDYLVGVTGAEVEISVDDRQPSVTVNAFLQKDEDEVRYRDALGQLSQFVVELADIFQVPVPKIDCSIIEDQDWANSWKEHFKPFTIIPGLVIKPTWEEYRAQGDEKVIEMDPGMAFGTGHHATTTLSLELVKTIVLEKGCTSVLDVGTGTGILGMAAALFGAEKILGIDNDPEAVAAAFENVHRNRLEKRMQILPDALGDVEGPFCLVVANIIHNVLIDLADDLAGQVAEGGHLVLSGILTGEQSEHIESLFTGKGFDLRRHLQKKEWSALLFKKTAKT
jgi:ribosomal protein L11 methyltransferase